jgi:hypothetical protein
MMQLIFPPSSSSNATSSSTNTTVQPFQQHHPARILLTVPKDFIMKEFVLNQIIAGLVVQFGTNTNSSIDNNGTIWIKNEITRHLNNSNSNNTVSQQPQPSSIEWSYFSNDGEVILGETTRRGLNSDAMDEALEKVDIKYVDNAEALRWVTANLHMFPHSLPSLVILDDFFELCNASSTTISPIEILAFVQEYLSAMSKKTGRPGCLLTIVTNHNLNHSTPISTSKLRWSFDSRIDLGKASETHLFASTVDHAGTEGNVGSIEKVLLKIV